mgnify:CR=1 FL=1
MYQVVKKFGDEKKFFFTPSGVGGGDRPPRGSAPGCGKFYAVDALEQQLALRV